MSRGKQIDVANSKARLAASEKIMHRIRRLIGMIRKRFLHVNLEHN